MRLNGERKNGRPITEIKTELTVMIRVRHRVKPPVPLILLFRVILKWRHREDIQTLLHLLKKKIHFLLFAVEFVTEDAKTLVQEVRLMRLLPLMK